MWEIFAAVLVAVVSAWLGPAFISLFRDPQMKRIEVIERLAALHARRISMGPKLQGLVEAEVAAGIRERATADRKRRERSWEFAAFSQAALVVIAFVFFPPDLKTESVILFSLFALLLFYIGRMSSRRLKRVGPATSFDS
ncbi:hypothetical protein [Paeniglutamicibacter psychrophenolicus]|uniref:Membrane protein implicated in regulation of membrane protease activity n=1 Tax=Paeniglutamicibacter psychrophenolicus TaxID=257454 RepID=A0ABS4WIR8_9MICC|nr:hypothetical protein [Paeniglutamicibacter psychrophenolicus]MBP2376078.1 membrane protein implicated in regulation of membrane protease activity [Paeniglutamicibacter psychrophenolicus]